MRMEYTCVADDDTKFTNYAECIQYERRLETQKRRLYEQSVREASNRFLLDIGFDPSAFETLRELNQAYNRTWIVFDYYGNIVGLKTCDNLNYPENGCDFCYVSGEDKKDRTIMENWLKEHRLFAHCLCSFVERSLEFYKLDLLHKLQILGWKVKHGRLF